LAAGRAGGGACRWRDAARRRAALRGREVRPELLGGLPAPRVVTVRPRAEARETVAVVPVRRGRETAGAFVVDSIGPLGLGRRRHTMSLPWAGAVYRARG